MKKIVLAFFASILFASPAVAHSALISADPAADSTLEVFPSTVTLTFNEALMKIGGGKSNTITLSSPSKVNVELGTPVISSNTISREVTVVPMEEGVYTVSYRVVSNDGHPIKGSYSFTYKSAGSVIAPAPATGDGEGHEEGELLEKGETAKALLIFIILAGIALFAYRRFIQRK